MLSVSKSHELVRTSLKNAAIYGTIADATDDEARAADYRRLRDIEIDLAKRWTEAASQSVPQPRAGCYSISLALLKLANKVLSPERLSGFLKRRYRHNLSAQSDEYLRHGLHDEAIESMAVLDRLSNEVDSTGQHIEHGAVATRTGALRAAVFGINDGLISNTSLVIGIAAAGAEPSVVLLAGAAGLISGALSMAAGEYVSVISQREFNENLIRWERTELLLWHDEEEQELVEILRSKGLDENEARSAAERIMSDPEAALDTHVREELGIDPEELGGSPIWAAGSSFITFAAGAFIPLLPHMAGLSGDTSIIASLGISGISLIIVGGGLGWLSGSGAIFSAARMLLIGGTAAAITYVLGTLVSPYIG